MPATCLIEEKSNSPATKPTDHKARNARLVRAARSACGKKTLTNRGRRQRARGWGEPQRGEPLLDLQIVICVLVNLYCSIIIFCFF